MILDTIYLAADRERDLPVSPYAIGATIFVVFCLVMWGLLMFGKGRPHA